MPGNTTSVPPTDLTAERADPPEGRIFGIIPNARSAAAAANHVALSPSEKFKIAASDSFDRGTIVLGAIFGAQGFLSTSNPSFGHGLGGYANYFGTGYGDFLIGNMMTEGVFPVLLRQDPRYFRAGSGKKFARVRSSIEQILWTTADSGRHQFNFSEVGGNALAVAISNTYYPDNRSAANFATKLTSQILVDTAANVLKEFSPDISRWMKRTRKHD